MPPVKLNVTSKSARSGKDYATHITVENPGKALAFFVHLKVMDKNGQEILPVVWDDNYFSLLPGEKRDITALYSRDSKNSKPYVEVDGWNVSQ